MANISKRESEGKTTYCRKAKANIYTWECNSSNCEYYACMMNSENLGDFIDFPDVSDEDFGKGID